MLRRLVPSLALTASAALFGGAPLRAQLNATFTVNQAASQCTWTGTSTLGPIVGNPSNQFAFAGTTALAVNSAPAASLSDATFNGGDTFTVPDIHGRIPNPIPIFPPLATIDIVGLHVTESSPVFTIGAGGAFSATLTLTATAGTFTVTPLGSAPTSTPLAGSSSAPSAVSGTLVVSGSALRLVMPIAVTFPFSDPTSGASGSVTLNGTLDATYQLEVSYCLGDGSAVPCPCANNGAAGNGCANSAFAAGARLSASGLPSVGNDLVALSATNVTGSIAIFFQGGSTLPHAVVDDGLGCVGGPIIRLGSKPVGGSASSFPQPGDPLVSVRGAVPAAGGTFQYQCFYRNAVAAFCPPATSNRTNGIQITWLP